MEENVFFYIDKQGIQQGPRTIKQLEHEYVITHQTMVWTQGMSDWKPAGEVEELRFLCYDQRPPVVNYQPPQPEPRVEPAQQINVPCPHTWLVESIIATVLCCLLFGVIGIVYAAKVENLWAAKRYDEARAAARTAKIMVLISAAVAFVTVLAYILFYAIGFIGLFGLSQVSL